MRLVAIIAVLLATLGMSSAAQDKEVTLAGEIVDLQCYMSKHGGEGRGPDHAGCANACINRGVTAGFVAKDGTLYVVFDEKMTSPKEKIAGMAGKPVSATGFVVERDGLKAIRVVKIEEAAVAP